MHAGDDITFWGLILAGIAAVCGLVISFFCYCVTYAVLNRKPRKCSTFESHHRNKT